MEDKIKSDLKAAMLAKDETKVSTLRMLISEMTYARVKKGVKNTEETLEDEEIVTVVQREIKKRQESVEAFEKVEKRLPMRTLWYQIEPIYAYYELGNFSRVMQITDKILNNNNRAFSELYILRARIYLKEGQKQKAGEQLGLAKLYNQNIEIDPNLVQSL